MIDHATLSRREREIAALVATGASNKEIAQKLAISIKTVKNILTTVFVKTQTRSRTELAIRLVRSEYATRAHHQITPVNLTRTGKRNTIGSSLRPAQQVPATCAHSKVKGTV